MNALIKLEEAVMFVACLVIFPQLGLSWWWFAGCILLPDIGMIGYLVNNKTGAYLYNLFHHKAIAIVIGLIGVMVGNTWLEFIGLILFAHASMDRMLGYGLKYEEGFRFTHLGEIGRKV
jgi:hypothetical protein